MRVAALKTSAHPFHQVPLLLATRMLARHGDFEFDDKLSSAREIEDDLLRGDPVLVLLSLPRPPKAWEKSRDAALLSEHIRFLLSHPSVVPLFLVFENRVGLAAQLDAWVRQSPQTLAKPETEALSTPLRWAFLTIDEVCQGSAAMSEIIRMVTMCADSAVFDPTGVRAFLEFLVCPRRIEDYIRRPPWFGLVIDDDRQTARRHAYFTRRLGYSTLVVDSELDWRNAVVSNSRWRGSATYDLVVTDDRLPFEGEPANIGFDAVDRLPAKHKIYVTGRGEERIQSRPRAVLQKPVFDIRQLIRFYHDHDGKTKGRLWNVLQQPYTVDGRTAEKGNHMGIAALCEIAKRLMATGEVLRARGLPWESAVHFFDAHRFYLGNDETGAAEALSAFQRMEVQELAGYYPDAEERLLWAERNAEIRAALEQTFPPHFVREPSWWMARTLRRMQGVLKENLASGNLIEYAEQGIRNAMEELYRKEGNWVRWFCKRITNGFATTLASIQLTFGAWALCTGIFWLIYMYSGRECTPPSGHDLPLWWRGTGAALAGGAGLFSPQDIGICMAGDRHLLLGLTQRVISLILMARLLDLFLTKARGRA